MDRKEAEKELAKVAVGFKALQSGFVSLAGEEQFERFMRWLG